MKKTTFLAAVVAMIGFGTVASADGLQDAYVEPVVTVAASDWTGSYVGLGFGTTTESSTNSAAPFVGYRFDAGDVVIGAEAEYRWQENSTDLTTVDAHVGYDAGKWLPYVSAGYQWDTNAEGAVYGIGVDYRLDNNNILGVKIQDKDYDSSDDLTVTARYAFKF